MFRSRTSKRQKQIRIIFSIVIIILLYKGMPAIMVSKPAIDVIIPNKAVTGIQYNEDNSIKIIGHGLENVHAVFINDVFEGEAVIISKTNEEIILQIPQKYYNLT